MPASRRGLANSAAGRVKPASEVFDCLEAKYKNWDDREADEALITAAAEPDLGQIADWIDPDSRASGLAFTDGAP